ncbi:MAG: LamG domain-containing protein, partial [Patescibacteria group bacterium]
MPNSPEINFIRKGKKRKVVIFTTPVLISLILFGSYAMLGGSFVFDFMNPNRAFAASVTWTGDGDGVNWEDADNWSNDAVPTDADDVTINTNVIVQINDAAATPIVHWLMNDNAASTTVVDAMGSVNGTAMQNTDAMTTAGQINTALALNGTSDYISASGTLPTGDYTFATWVNLDTNNDEMLFNINSNKIDIRVLNTKVRVIDSGGVRMTSAAAVATGGWHHVAVTRNAGRINVYIDGVKDVNTGTSVGDITAAACGITVGAYFNCTTSHSSYLDGSMDDVRMYDHGLESYEIADIYNT